MSVPLLLVERPLLEARDLVSGCAGIAVITMMASSLNGVNEEGLKTQVKQVRCS